jgi:DNA-directed RNA polymerase specialized sigma24 family protein
VWICESGYVRAWLRWDPEAKGRIVMMILDRARPRLMAQSSGGRLVGLREDLFQDVALATTERAATYERPQDVDIADPLSWVIGVGRHKSGDALEHVLEQPAMELRLEDEVSDDELEVYEPVKGDGARTPQPEAAAGEAPEGAQPIETHPADWRSAPDLESSWLTLYWGHATLTAWRGFRSNPGARKLAEVMGIGLSPKEVETLAICLRIPCLRSWTLAEAARDLGIREGTLRCRVSRLRGKLRAAGVDPKVLDRLLRPEKFHGEPEENPDGPGENR